MQRRKSTPWHDQIAADEAADIVQRDAAIVALTVDQLYQFEPLFARLLKHQSADLRGRAARSLLGMWGMGHYFEPVAQMLRCDPEASARSDAASALLMYALYNGGDRERITRELAAALVCDPDWIVQQTCYEAVLELIPGTHNPHYLDSLTRPFERETDVDWALIQPYLPQQDNKK